MPESPNRQRLAVLMEQRRKDLRLRWQDVAERSGLSLKTLHSVRSSDKRVAELTKTGIEDGLRWEHGSIDLVLAGGDPVPLSSADPGPQEASPLSVLPGGAPESLPDDAPPSPSALAFAQAFGVRTDDPRDPFVQSVRKDIAEAIMAYGASASGGQIFHGRPWSADEARFWDSARMPRADREMFIVGMRAERARNESGQGNGITRIGLVAATTSGGTWPQG